MHAAPAVGAPLGATPSAAAPATSPPAPSVDGTSFLKAIVNDAQASTPQHLAALRPGDDQFAIYDNALTVLALVGEGKRTEAERILVELARLQAKDGSLPFSGSVANPQAAPGYVRTGALAWVGYAAARYLDDDAGGSNRPLITQMAHKIASYLLSHQVTDAKDPRSGLILGGSGSYHNVLRDGKVVEEFSDSDIDWASTEHNIDAYFFFRIMYRVTGTPSFQTTASTIGNALIRALWRPEVGQFAQGVSPRGRDDAEALDCASWGALFLRSHRELDKAAQATRTAEQRYASSLRGVSGHRPYVNQPLVEPQALADLLNLPAAANDWSHFPAVWPEGSAGVALATLRGGDPLRTIAIINDLNKLRGSDSALPDLTDPVPFAFGGKSSIAGTMWVMLVQQEIKSGRATLWSEPE